MVDMINLSSNGILLNAFLAIGILVLGIILGNVISHILKYLFNKIDLDKKMRPSFVGLIITLIQWCVYIVFFNMALTELQIPLIMQGVTRFLLVIPAMVFALITLSAGFVIAIYLRSIVEDAEITGWQMFSKYIYYFVLLVSGIYSLKVALVSLNDSTSDIIVIGMVLILTIGILYYNIKKELQKH